MDLSKRDTPRKSLLAAMEEFKRRNGTIIVEIGCMRQPCKHTAHDPCSDDCLSRCDGHSTMMLASLGKHMWSIDISRKAVENARRHVREHSRCQVIQEDGIVWMRKWPVKIDLLYLDFIDVDLPGCAEKHLEIYEIARDRRLFGKRALILIDDTDLVYEDGEYKPDPTSLGGKGKLAIPQAIKDGWTMLFKGRQVLLAR